MTSESTISERLEKARTVLGLTQVEVAQATGKDPAQVSKWERGLNRPRPSALRKISEVLRVNMRWLTYGEGPMEAPEMPKPPVGAEGLVSSNSAR